MSPVKQIPLKVTCDNLDELVQFLYPDSNPVYQKCKDGITNTLFQCTVRDEAFLIRIYGNNTEILIDRSREVENLVKLHAANLAPEVIAQFENGLVYRFIPGRILSIEELARYAPEIATLLHKWHQLETSDSSLIWDTIAGWLKYAPDKTFEKELEWLKQKCQSFDCPVVFSHNDLLHANVIIDPDQKIHFIDYEYASPAELPFDIANHFCEYAGFECNYEMFPSETTQKLFISAYYGKAATQEKVDDLYEKVKWFCLASHMYWALWAKVQEKISEIEFCYGKYAEMRWSAYTHLKKRLMEE